MVTLLTTWVIMVIPVSLWVVFMVVGCVYGCGMVKKEGNWKQWKWKPETENGKLKLSNLDVHVNL